MDDLVKHLRNAGRAFVDNEYNLHARAANRIEQLEAALRRIACDGEPYDKCHCVNSEGCSYGIARSALKEKKDGNV
jgi:hypothetical protein